MAAASSFPGPSSLYQELLSAQAILISSDEEMDDRPCPPTRSTIDDAHFFSKADDLQLSSVAGASLSDVVDSVVTEEVAAGVSAASLASSDVAHPEAALGGSLRGDGVDHPHAPIAVEPEAELGGFIRDDEAPHPHAASSAIPESGRLPSRPTKWGRCWRCLSPMKLVVTQDGRHFLGCSKYQPKNPASCEFTHNVPAGWEDRLPPIVRKKRKVDF